MPGGCAHEMFRVTACRECSITPPLCMLCKKEELNPNVDSSTSSLLYPVHTAHRIPARSHSRITYTKNV